MIIKRFGIASLVLLFSAGLLFAEENDKKPILAEFTTSEHVTLYVSGREQPTDFELHSQIAARVPRPCKKPFKLDVDLFYTLSVDRKPVAGLEPLIKSLEKFKILGIYFRYAVPGKDLELLSGLKCLKTLKFEEQCIDKHCFSALGKLEGLERLTFLRCEFQECEEAKAIEAIPVLKALHLLDCKGVECVAKSFSKCPWLKILSLTGEEVTDKLLSYLKNIGLIWLSLASNNITDEGFAQINIVKALLRLTLQGKKLTIKCLSRISEMVDLVDLELVDMTGLNDFPDLPRGRYLGKLSIRGTDLGRGGLRKILDAFYYIQELELINNPQVFNDSPDRKSSSENIWMRHVLDRLHLVIPGQLGGVMLEPASIELRALWVEREEIQPVDLTFKRQKIHNARYSGVLHPDCLKLLLENNSGFTALEFSKTGLKGVDADEALKLISKQELLTSLKVDSVYSDSFEWISSLAGLPLEYLSLNNISSITDETIGKFNEFKHLTQLDLRGRPNFTAAGIKKLENMEHLVCFNPTPLELVEEHEKAVEELVAELATVIEADRKLNGGYYRSGISIFPKLALDIRDNKFGYTFRYFSNSKSDDASKFVFLAFPARIEDGTRAILLTESGTMVTRKLLPDDLEFFRSLNEKNVGFSKDPGERLDGMKFEEKK